MTTSMRLTKGTKVEVFTGKEVVSGSWLPATILSVNARMCHIQYDDCQPGLPVSYDRVPRKVVRLPVPPPPRTPSPPPPLRLILRIKRPSTCGGGGDDDDDDDDDGLASVGSNSPHHRPAGNQERRWSHRDELKIYRSYMTMLYKAGPGIPWEEYMCMNDISNMLGITLEEHCAVLHELIRSPWQPDALSSA